MDSDPSGARGDELRCPVCQDPLAGRPVSVCRSCETPIHEECAAYVGGCARFACVEAATPRRRIAELIALRRAVESSGWVGTGLFALLALGEAWLAGATAAWLSIPAGLLAVTVAGLGVNALRPETSHTSLLADLERCRSSDLDRERLSAHVAVVIGIGYAGLRLVLWRGPWPFAMGVVFAVGCFLFAHFSLTARGRQAELARLAALWHAEIRALIDTGKVDGTSKVKLVT